MLLSMELALYDPSLVVKGLHALLKGHFPLPFQLRYWNLTSDLCFSNPAGSNVYIFMSSF